MFTKTMLWVIVGVLVAAVLFWRFWFLRKPKRTIPRAGIVSPANGRLVKIIPFHNETAVVPKGMLGHVRVLTKDVAKVGYILVIMLTPLDVHYQRAPIAGTIKNITYRKGEFKNAVFGAAELKGFANEKNEILLKGKETVKVVQVAGVLARRISCAVQKGKKVKKGDILGLINLGSQTLLIMPKKKLKVHEGDYLIDGETVIA